MHPMRNLVSRLQKSLSSAGSGPVSAIWQGVLHIAAIYALARLFTPWLLDVTLDKVLPFLLGRPLGGNPFQFFFSHLLAFSFLPGLVAGFAIAKIFGNKIIRFVWLVPVAVLLFLFVFTGPGMYPTMLWESDFRQAFHYFFGAGFRIVGEFHNFRDFPTLMGQNMSEFLRGYAQLRVTVPAYVGAGYSLGAWLSLGIKKKNVRSQTISKVVTEVSTAS
jgi:hypothetical protein